MVFFTAARTCIQARTASFHILSNSSTDSAITIHYLFIISSSTISPCTWTGFRYPLSSSLSTPPVPKPYNGLLDALHLSRDTPRKTGTHLAALHILYSSKIPTTEVWWRWRHHTRTFHKRQLNIHSSVVRKTAHQQLISLFRPQPNSSSLTEHKSLRHGEQPGAEAGEIPWTRARVRAQWRVSLPSP